MESLITAFQKELHTANEQAFQSYIQSFLNIWSYEYNSFDEIPFEVSNLIHLSDYDILTDQEI
ncbi:hypothetical protein [Aeribacillus alveayuensis]|jgi:hypothetical protein|uniref:Uncharacterized protein n=1 Tax=Aeribacillus alveayuensis TaxID=279215 RepID=A0ABT9VIZ8_9BACI|nr:hypothetical protein [Bacillus alveayuensis]